MFRRTYEQRPDHCPNCKHDTALARLDRRLVWPAASENLVLPSGPCVMEDVWACTFCQRTVVELRVYGPDHAHGSDVFPDEVRVVWPPFAPRELSEEVPENVSSLYREASIAERAGALRGAGALYRAAVEQLCTSLGASGSNLRARIENLSKYGVDKEVISDLHEARLLGNWTLHEGIEFTADEVADVAELIAEATYVIYAEPARREMMRNARRTRRSSANEASPDHAVKH